MPALPLCCVVKQKLKAVRHLSILPAPGEPGAHHQLISEQKDFQQIQMHKEKCQKIKDKRSRHKEEQEFFS